MGDGTFIGRTEELGRLERITARRKGFALVELIGEPGIGKSRLAAETCRRAEEAGWSVASGRSGEFEGDRPFGVFVAALDDRIAELGRPVQDTFPELAQIFPALAGDGASGGLAAERYVTYRAVRRLLEALADPRGLFRVLDDLHWADRDSAELLGYLLRQRQLYEESGGNPLYLEIFAREQARARAGRTPRRI